MSTLLECAAKPHLGSRKPRMHTGRLRSPPIRQRFFGFFLGLLLNFAAGDAHCQSSLGVAGGLQRLSGRGWWPRGPVPSGPPWG